MDGDPELVARIRRGDRDSFDDLYDRYADDVFSLCLVVLGDPVVAKAAAGTAFALVARTRLDLLSDPDRLRSWLLELARGSALAWSGSPRARSVPIPHGIAAETMIDGAVVPAPLSLRIGLTRTFDRAAMAAAEELAAQRMKVGAPATSPGVAADAGALYVPSGTASALSGVEPATGHIAPSHASHSRRSSRSQRRSQRSSLVDAAGPPADDGHAEAAAVAGPAMPEVLPFPHQPTASRSAPAERRTRPAFAAAAALAMVAAGTAVAVNWPSSGSSTEATKVPDAVVVGTSTVPGFAAPTTPPGQAPAQAPAHAAAPAQVLPPTVAGAYTRVPSGDTMDDEGPPMAVPVGNGPMLGPPGAGPAPSSNPPAAAAPGTSRPPSTPPASTTNPPVDPPPSMTLPPPPPPTVPDPPPSESTPGDGGGTGMAPTSETGGDTGSGTGGGFDGGDGIVDGNGNSGDGGDGSSGGDPSIIMIVGT